MKYIFLDVDGVLNDEKYIKKCYNKNGHKGFFCDNVPFNPKSLKRLAKIVRKTKSTIVLTSTWRLSDTSIAILKARLAEYGLRIDNFTDVYNHIRGLEIKKWLKEHDFNWNTDNYIVIDDDTNDIISHIDEDKVIKVNPYYGLSWENMWDSIIKLG